MKIYTNSLLRAFLPIIAAVALSPTAWAQCNINMGANQQTMDGFGFSSAWCGQLSTAKNNALYNTLGFSLLRIRIDPNQNWNDETVNAAAAHARGAKVLGSPWSPPAYMKDNNDLNNGGHLLPSYYAAYAQRLHDAAISIGLDYVSLQNEPDWAPDYESCEWNGTQFHDFCVTNAPAIGKPIVMPEAVNFQDQHSDPTLNDPAAASNVTIVAGHFYGGGNYVHQNALNKGKHVWETENYETGGQSDFNACMKVAKTVSDAMNNQFSAYFWWWVNDSQSDGTCLVNSSGTIIKPGYILGQYAKWIRPGSTRVTANYIPQSNVYVTAYRVNGGAVIVAVNMGSTAVSQQFNIQNGNAATMQGYRTSSTENMSDIGSFPVSAGSFTANLPAQSVTTFVQSNIPTALTATALSSTQVALAWNPVAGAGSYRVKRSAYSGGPYQTVATGITSTSFTDTVNSGMRYYYVVSAVTGSLEGPNSLEARVNPPYPWKSGDIGSVGVPGSVNSESGVFTVDGSGADIWGTADALRYVYLPASGNFTITARVPGVENTDVWAKAGVMIRESLNADSRNAFVGVTPGNGVTWQYRANTTGTSNNASTAGFSAPYWVRIVRSGNTFTGYRSPDGVTWTQQGTPQTITMATAVYAGLAVTSHNNTNVCTATFDNVSVPGWLNPVPPPAPAGLTATAANRKVALSWPASANATSYNVKRAMTAGGPYTFLTNVATTSYTDAALANNVAYYYVVSSVNIAGESSDSPEAGVPGQLVSPTGLTVTQASAARVNLAWNSFSGATGYNVKRSPVSGGPYTTFATGVAGTTFTDPAAATKFYYVVSAIVGAEETQNSDEATFNLPYPWLTQDVGSVGLAGSALGDSGVFTIKGSGADIQGTADAFRFAYVAVTGNFTLVARVASMENTNPWAKAGVMIRASLAAGAANAFVGMTPGNGATWQSRTGTGGATTYNNTGGLSAPYWVRLVRSVDTVTGYRSPDGTTWTQQGTVTLSGISTAYVGLAVTSHNNASLCSATFDNVAVPGWPPSLVVGLATVQSAKWIGLTWGALTGATSYNVKRATTSGGPYATIATGVTGTSFTDTGVNLLADIGYYYVLSAIVGGLQTADGPEAAASIPPLTGAIIGTPGSYNNLGDTIAKVFDGNLATFFDGPASSNGNGCWAGRDFGAGVGNVIRQIRYCPRSGFADRMVGGMFQGANQADFSDAVTLATVGAAPPSDVLTSANITGNATFRYVRYLSPNGSSGNIAEVEFYGFLGAVPVPTGLVATAGDAQVPLTWNATPGVTSYKVSRATTIGSLYTALATPGTTSLLDSSVTNGTTYYYVVSGLNTGIESPPSSPASARPSTPITTQEMQVVSAMDSGSANLTVSSSVVGHTYQLQYSDDLSLGNWQNYGAAVAGNGGSIIFSMPTGGERGFYRILIER